VVLLTSVQFYATGVFAVLDAPFTMLVTAAMVFLYQGYVSTGTGRRRTSLLLAGIFLGAAFLVKGFIAFVVPGLSLVLFLLVERRLGAIVSLLGIPTLTAGVVCLPWALAIGVRDPEFWPYFVWTEHVQRFLTPSGAQHPEPVWFFVPVLLVGTLPWGTMAPAAAAGLRDALHDRTLLRFCLSWFAVTFVFFSASSGKLSTYILPLYPPFAMLMAMGLHAYLRREKHRLWQAGAAVSAVVAAAAAVLAVLWRDRLFDGDNPLQPQLLVVSLVVWALLAVSAGLLRGDAPRLAIFAASPLLFLFCLNFSLPTLVMAPDTPEQLLRGYATRYGNDTTVVADIHTLHAVCWVFDRSDVQVIGGTGELTFGIEHEPTQPRRFSLTQCTTPRVLLVVRPRTFEQYRHELPEPVFTASRSGILVAELVLGHWLDAGKGCPPLSRSSVQ